MVRVIAIILLLYFGLRLLGRLFSPTKKPASGSAQNPRDEMRQEGDVRIEYTDQNKAKRKHKDTGEGEYVDFEELD